MSPCFRCTTRTATCHSTCKDYFDWVAEENEKKEKIKANKEDIYLDYKCEAIIRVKKKGQL